MFNKYQIKKFNSLMIQIDHQTLKSNKYKFVYDYAILQLIYQNIDYKEFKKVSKHNNKIIDDLDLLKKKLIKLVLECIITKINEVKDV